VQSEKTYQPIPGIRVTRFPPNRSAQKSTLNQVTEKDAGATIPAMEVDFAYRSHKSKVCNLPAGTVIKHGNLIAIKTSEGKEFVDLKSGDKFHIESSGEVDVIQATLYIR
jgi:hypothetical protein